MSDELTIYNTTTKLSEGVYVFEDGNSNWGARCNRNFELLNESLKGKTLTLKVGSNVAGTFSTVTNKTITLDTASNEDIDALI